MMKSRLSKREFQFMKENNVTENFVCQIDNLRNYDYFKSHLDKNKDFERLTNDIEQTLNLQESKMMKDLNYTFVNNNCDGKIYIFEFCPVSQKFNVFLHLTQFYKDNSVFVESELN